MKNYSLQKRAMHERFRGFLPVVIDIETAGFNAETDALLELAAVFLTINSQGVLVPDECHAYHITPFAGANLDADALEFNQIDPDDPLRCSVNEESALTKLFDKTKQQLERQQCQRAVLVGHNPWFDLTFLLAATTRCNISQHPFHRFTTFDTATLGALAYGQTVLARAARAAHLPFDRNLAHSAIYDAQQTAKLFCKIVNQWDQRFAAHYPRSFNT